MFTESPIDTSSPDMHNNNATSNRQSNSGLNAAIERAQS